MNEQTSLRSLHEIKSCGKVSVDDLYYSDFNIPRRCDILESIFLIGDTNYFVCAQLFLNHVHYATITPDKIHQFNNELAFFTNEVSQTSTPFTAYTIRLVYNKNCIEHAKIFTVGRIIWDTEKRQQHIDSANSLVAPTAITSEASVTKKEIPLHHKDGVLCSDAKEFLWKKIKYIPTYNLHHKDGMYTYSFDIPNLGKLKKIICHNSGGLARLIVGGWDLSEIKMGNYEKSRDLIFLRKANNNPHLLRTDLCIYSMITIEIVSKEKLCGVYIDLTFKFNDKHEIDKKVLLSDGKTLWYHKGAICPE